MKFIILEDKKDDVIMSQDRYAINITSAYLIGAIVTLSLVIITEMI